MKESKVAGRSSFGLEVVATVLQVCSAPGIKHQQCRLWGIQKLDVEARAGVFGSSHGCQCHREYLCQPISPLLPPLPPTPPPVPPPRAPPPLPPPPLQRHRQYEVPVYCFVQHVFSVHAVGLFCVWMRLLPGSTMIQIQVNNFITVGEASCKHNCGVCVFQDHFQFFRPFRVQLQAFMHARIQNTGLSLMDHLMHN